MRRDNAADAAASMQSMEAQKTQQQQKTRAPHKTWLTSRLLR